VLSLALNAYFALHIGLDLVLSYGLFALNDSIPIHQLYTVIKIGIMDLTFFSRSRSPFACQPAPNSLSSFDRYSNELVPWRSGYHNRVDSYSETLRLHGIDRGKREASKRYETPPYSSDPVYDPKQCTRILLLYQEAPLTHSPLPPPLDTTASTLLISSHQAS
jgi:hypothetical protein